LKKEPKNFYKSGLSLSGEAEAQTDKSFLLLFFKKEGLASMGRAYRAVAGLIFCPSVAER
jgi:hypothetical protein